MFAALLPALLPRLQAFRRTPLRAQAALMPGLLEAPVGPVAVACCQVRHGGGCLPAGGTCVRHAVHDLALQPC